MNKAEDYLKKWCTRRYGDDFEPKFGNWGERNMVNFAEYFAAEQIKEAQDNYIDQLEAENKELNEKVKRVEMYAEFCIECDRNNMNPLEFESYLNLNIK